PAPPVTKMVEPFSRAILVKSCRRMPASVGTRYRHQIFAIAAFSALLCRLLEGLKRDVAFPQRNLLRAGNARALSLLQDLDEMAGFDQRGMSTSVEPGKAAAQHFDVEIAPFEIGPVDVGNLQLTAPRRFHIGCDIENIVVVEIEPSNGDI